MIILDTNVISALMRIEPEKRAVKWLDEQPASSVWITSITVMEIYYGLRTMPIGRRREMITKSFEIVLREKIEGRVAPFDTAAAEQAANLMALRKSKGRPADVRDTMIASIALASRAALATRNTPHFKDVPVAVVNPWAE